MGLRANPADVTYEEQLTALKLSRLPSDYFRDNVRLTFQDDWVAFQVAHLLDHHCLMWASDHPHSDATFPDSQSVLEEHTAQLDPQVRDDILWRNCAELYGLTPAS